jgi:glycosyltransferase involved in cell wall biosynthesis
MSRIAILSPSLTTADAVSNDALGMYDVLQRLGRNVKVFCETHDLKHPAVQDVSRIRAFLKSPDDILIYHFARGWTPGLSLLREMKCRKVIKYHNITPPTFFTGFSSSDEDLCQAGRKELIDVAGSDCELYLSDSAFNMGELVALGTQASKCFVVPPFHHIDRLADVAADDTILRDYSDGKANILTVGRVVPNKGHLALLEAFASFHFNCNAESRLIIVGKGGEGLTPYSRLLHRAVEALGLNRHVVFGGAASDEELKAFYQVADAFVTTSEHEGFCVPLVEAMAMNVPIAAYASSAIPETVGQAGIVWDERKPELLAESINSIVSDKAISEGLSAMAWRRYQQVFTNERIRKQFIEVLGQVLPTRNYSLI